MGFEATTAWTTIGAEGPWRDGNFPAFALQNGDERSERETHGWRADAARRPVRERDVGAARRPERRHVDRQVARRRPPGATRARVRALQEAPGRADPGRDRSGARQAARTGGDRARLGPRGGGETGWLRIHIVDYFGPTPVYEITREDVRGFSAALERKGLAPKSRANALGTLHSLIEFAIGEGWTSGENPVKRVEKPALATTDPTSTSSKPRRSRRCCAPYPTSRSAASSA